MISKLIEKIVPRFGISIAFWWRIRAKVSLENQSQREKDFRAKITVVASQPTLISSYLLRAYVLYLCGVAMSILGVLMFFVGASPDAVSIYGPKYSWSWWFQTFGELVKVVFFISLGVQIIKLGNQRYLIATIAEERLMDKGLEKLTSAASPAPPSAP